MNTFTLIILALLCLSVLGVLVTGILSFAAGGDFNKKHGNKLMQARVVLQGLALALLALAYFSTQA